MSVTAPFPANGDAPWGDKLRTRDSEIVASIAALETLTDGLPETYAPIGLGMPVTRFGASPTATPSQNTTAFRAGVEWCRTNALGVRSLFIPPTAADQQYSLNDDVKVTGGVSVSGVGALSRVKQTAKTKAIFRSCSPGQRFSYFHVIGADDRETVPDGGGANLIRDQHPFANHMGVAFQYGSGGGSAVGITGENINIVVGCWGWSDDTNGYAGNIQGLTVQDIRGEDVWCVFFAREVDNLVYGRISGKYKRLPLIFADPHLIYLTSSNYVSSFRPLLNARGSGFTAYDSVGGEPIAVKDVIGGSIDGIIVRNCPGIAIFAEVDGLTVGPYIAEDIWKDPTSVGTANSPSGGQSGMLTLSACKNFTLAPGSRQRNKPGNQAKAIAMATASETIAWCENIEIAVPYIETNHATDDLADNRAEVYVYGVNTRAVFGVGSQINALGGVRHLVRMAGPSPSVVAPRASRCAQVVVTNGIGTNEVQRITLSGTGGTFTLSFNGQTTTAIPYDADAASVQAALRALSTIGAGNVNVTGGPGPATPYTATFTGNLAARNVSTLVATSSLTGGATPGVTIAVVTEGVTGVAKVVDYIAANVVRTIATDTPIRVSASADNLLDVLSAPPSESTWDRGLIASPSGRLISLSSGERPIFYGSGAVVKVQNGRWIPDWSTSTLPRYTVFEKGTTEVSVQADVWLGELDSGGSGTYSVGLALCAVSETTNLLVELRSDRVTVSFRNDAGSLNIVGTAGGSALAPYGLNRKNTLRATKDRDRVNVYVDGFRVLQATLTSDQLTALAAGTRHGIVGRQSLASAWANLRIEGLIAA